MTTPRDSIERIVGEVLSLDTEARPLPWTCENTDTLIEVCTRSGPGVCTVDADDALGLPNARLIAHYREAAPRLARALVEAVRVLPPDAITLVRIAAILEQP